jgi:hypothetical protein
MKPIVPFVCLALVALTSCESLKARRTAESTPVPLTAEETDIYEAAFRHLFANNASMTKQTAAAYFISINGMDPTDTFLSRFSGNQPPVKRASLARTGRHNAVCDGAFGRKALSFGIDSVRRIDRDIVEVDCGYCEAILSASVQTLRLRRTSSGWIVIKDTLHALA